MPCEVLRQCSATNPADIIIYGPSMTVLGLRKIPFYISCPFCGHCCLYAYVYIILTPYEYYMVLPAVAINAALQSNRQLSSHVIFICDVTSYISK